MFDTINVMAIYVYMKFGNGEEVVHIAAASAGGRKPLEMDFMIMLLACC